MGRKKAGCTPIQPRVNREEWNWAYEYLCNAVASHNDITMVHSTFKGEPNPERVAQLIIQLQISPMGREMVRSFANALRQYRYRRKNKNRASCTFMLTKEAKKALSSHAKIDGKTESHILSELLTDSFARARESISREETLHARLAAEIELRKQVEALWKAKHAQAMVQVEKLATLLSKWELSMDTLNPEYSGSPEQLKRESQKKVRAVEIAIRQAEAFHDESSLSYFPPAPPISW